MDRGSRLERLQGARESRPSGDQGFAGVRHGSPVTREYESNLCRFYNLEGYWTHETCPDDDPSKPAN